MDAEGQNVRRLTGQGPANQEPVWSPTADVIAFQSNSDGEFEIYTIDANSTPGSTDASS